MRNDAILWAALPLAAASAMAAPSPTEQLIANKLQAMENVVRILGNGDLTAVAKADALREQARALRRLNASATGLNPDKLGLAWETAGDRPEVQRTMKRYLEAVERAERGQESAVLLPALRAFAEAL